MLIIFNFNKMSIAIINYDIGNIYSIFKAVKYITHKKILVTNNINKINNATHIILPGQGAIKNCIEKLRDNNLLEYIYSILTNSIKPVLGICLGLQILMTMSEENNGVSCLNYFKGKVKKFPYNSKNTDKIPHMGWNIVKQKYNHFLWNGIKRKERFYFAHSYYVKIKNNKNIFGITNYCGINAHVAIAKNTNFSVQFHPEKSGPQGIRLLTNFINWYV